MNWKILAIVLFVIVVIETGILVWAWESGNREIKNEVICKVEVCKDYETYYYDNYEGVCYCFVNGEVEKAEQLRK